MGRVIHGMIGKKRRGAEVARKDILGKFQPAINTVQIRFKEKLNESQEHLMNDLKTAGKTRIKMEDRSINTRRLGRCLAKMAVETVAYLKPDAIAGPDLESIRRYALGQGPLKFLPYALGSSKGQLGVKLAEIAFSNEPKRVLVSFIYLPLCVYAVQLTNHEDLHPLWHVSKLYKMIFDENGNRTKKFTLYMNLELGDRPRDQR